jgi:tetratricopeptide (TPR) repeat protein
LLTVTASSLPVIVSTALRAGLHALASDVLDVFGQSVLAKSGDPVARAHVLTCRSWQAMFDGDYAACVNYDSEVLRCMKEAGDTRQACLARVHVGYDYLILGAYDRAVVELSAAQQEAERWALETVEQLAKHNLSLALHRLGESDRGLEMQRECLAYALHRRNQLEEGHARHYLALILFERGEHDASRIELERVLANMPSSALRWETLARLAAIQMARGDLGEAQLRIDEAVLGVEQLRNAEEGDGYVRLVAVLVRRALGDENGANALLVAARNRLLWRAGRIADPALRRSFMRAIPEHATTLELAEQLATAGRNR